MAEGLGGTGNRGTDKQQMGEGGEEHEVGEQWTRYGETDNRVGFGLLCNGSTRSWE
ncbi:hypothetical protein TIFTF001_009005 [Ficus carica]|uniref:Uncharacterized protein n=1 Tax=Ficus carica TaxID=3494 RepID=A0AA88CYK2_FICCA|nr:hypothetical protein TIFTF001_009005 [Ficus carica]